MASGKDLKRRITSVKSTQQITKAMKMVAAARLRRAQEAVVRARPFSKAIKQTVANLLRSEKVTQNHPLLEVREKKNAVIIIVTSDRGLCGGFNSALLKRAEAFYRSESAKYGSLKFVCIGKKGNEYFTHRKIPVAEFIPDFQKGLSYAKAEVFADEWIEKFKTGEIDEMRVMFSEFRSAVSQIPTMHVLLPVNFEAEIASGEIEVKVNSWNDFIFEPSLEEILDRILPRYIKSKIYKALLESAASEHGARMAAMDSATKNAGEMIRKLTLEYNKVRQAGITKELLEIVSGAEALK